MGHHSTATITKKRLARDSKIGSRASLRVKAKAFLDEFFNNLGTLPTFEASEAHHWGMRDAPDEAFVVSAYLAAYNAKANGVKDHVVQMMFNSPPGTSSAMDIAKMLAVIELVSTLETQNFKNGRKNLGLSNQIPANLLSMAVGKFAKAHVRDKTTWYYVPSPAFV